MDLQICVRHHRNGRSANCIRCSHSFNIESYLIIFTDEGRSIDIASRPEGQGAQPTKDWLRFWARPGNCVYPADFDDLDV